MKIRLLAIWFTSEIHLASSIMVTTWESKLPTQIFVCVTKFTLTQQLS